MKTQDSLYDMWDSGNLAFSSFGWEKFCEVWFESDEIASMNVLKNPIEYCIDCADYEYTLIRFLAIEANEICNWSDSSDKRNPWRLQYRW